MIDNIRPLHTVADAPDREPFSQHLARLRTDQKLSQNALAHLAGIDAAYVWRMELGESRRRHGRTDPHRISRAVALALARALDLDDVATDRFLVAAGQAPDGDWITRALDAESTLARIRRVLREDAP